MEPEDRGRGDLARGGDELAVQPRPGEGRVRRGERGRNVDPDLPQLRHAEDDDHQPVGQEAEGHARARELPARGLRTQFVGSVGPPEAQQERHGGEGDEGGEDGRELVGEEVSGGDVAQAHRHARDERGRPGLPDPAPAVEDRQEEDGDPAQEQRGDAPLGRADRIRRGPAELGRRRHRNRHRAEADVQRVADHRHQSRFQGRQAEGQEHGAGDSDRRPETGEPLDEAAEAEADEEGLDAHVAPADRGEHRPDVLGAARPLGEVVQPHRHDDDVDDREDPEGRPLRGGEQREVHRHAESEDRHEHGDAEGGDRAHVRLHFEGAQEDEEESQRQQPEERREDQGGGDRGGRRGERRGQLRRGGGSVQRFDGRRHCYVLGVGGIRGGVSGPVRPVRTVWPVNHGCPAV